MPSRQPSRFLVVAGGTGGHILPGIRIGEALASAGGDALRVEYLSGPRPIERQVYAGEGIQPRVMATGGWRGFGQQAVQGLEFAADVCRLTADFIMNRPVGVLAMGGAASFPVLTAAVLLGVPIYLHESNRVPGRVIRLFRRHARRVLLGLGGLDGANVDVVGTPTRRPEPLVGSRDVVLCVGGSQGSARLNALFLEVAEDLATDFPSYKFVLVGGPSAKPEKRGRIEVHGYEPNLPALLARTEVIVSRAGAGALADVANFRIPGILVPYPFAKDDHQRANALVFSEAGAALLRDEAGLTAATLAEDLRGLLANEQTRRLLLEALAPFDSTDSADRIATLILTDLRLSSLADEIPRGATS